jgi:hypothetical protein
MRARARALTLPPPRPGFWMPPRRTLLRLTVTTCGRPPPRCCCCLPAAPPRPALPAILSGARLAPAPPAPLCGCGFFLPVFLISSSRLMSSLLSALRGATHGARGVQRPCLAGEGPHALGSRLRARAGGSWHAASSALRAPACTGPARRPARRQAPAGLAAAVLRPQGLWEPHGGPRQPDPGAPTHILIWSQQRAGLRVWTVSVTLRLRARMTPRGWGEQAVPRGPGFPAARRQQSTWLPPRWRCSYSPSCSSTGIAARPPPGRSTEREPAGSQHRRSLGTVCLVSTSTAGPDGCAGPQWRRLRELTC